MPDYNEKELVVAYVNARNRYEEQKAISTQAYNEMQRAVLKLVEYMEDVGTTATAKYDGIGRVSMTKPILSAKFDEEHRSELYEYLRREGLSECIKETIHASTLSSIIRQKIEQGEPLPDFIQTSYRKDVKLSR